MQKQGKFFFEGHRSTFWIKMPIGIGHPPPTHQLQSTCVGEGSRVPNLQTEFNYLDSFKSYGIFSDFVVPTWSHSPRVIPVIPMSSPSSPHHLHIVSTSSPSSPSSPSSSCCPHSPQKVHMWSPWSVVSTCCPRHPHIIPVIPTSSPHCLKGPHIIPNPQIPTPSTPWPPGGVGAPNQ